MAGLWALVEIDAECIIVIVMWPQAKTGTCATAAAVVVVQMLA